jgi:hypothetical protein
LLGGGGWLAGGYFFGASRRNIENKKDKRVNVCTYTAEALEG